MKTTTDNTQQNVVKDLRKIREQISNEIKHMTFAEERAYLDRLLKDESKSLQGKNIAGSGADSTLHQQ